MKSPDTPDIQDTPSDSAENFGTFGTRNRLMAIIPVMFLAASAGISCASAKDMGPIPDSVPAAFLNPSADIEALLARFPRQITAEESCVDAVNVIKANKHKSVSNRAGKKICRFLIWDEEEKVVIGKDEEKRKRLAEEKKPIAFWKTREAVFKTLENLFGRLILIPIDEKALVPFASYEVGYDEDPNDWSLAVRCTFDFSGPEGRVFLVDLLSRATAAPDADEIGE